MAVSARDVPVGTMAVPNAEAALTNTRKRVGTGPLSTLEAEAIIELGAAITWSREALRERPLVYLGVCPVSPLKLPQDVTEVVMASARAGMPDNVLSMATAGASSPVTLAVDDFRAVGPFSGFLSPDSTMRHMRIQSQPMLVERRVREEWEGMGGQDACARARDKVWEIMARHRPDPLSDDMLARMRDVNDWGMLRHASHSRRRGCIASEYAVSEVDC